MPTKQFKAIMYAVNAARLEGSGEPTAFQEAVTAACNTSTLPDREKVIADKRHRLNDEYREGDVFFLNFVSFSYAGQGRVRQGLPQQPINMQDDESFDPETAILYDAQNALALVESATYAGGVGPGAIARYFQMFIQPGTYYTLLPLVDPDASTRARLKQQIGSLQMRLQLSQVTALDNQAGISPVKGFGNHLAGETIDIVVSAGRGKDKSLSIGAVLELVKALVGDGGDNGTPMPELKRLKVSGRENTDEPAELIDLIQQRENSVRPLDIDPVTRKVTREARWNALRSMHLQYLEKLP